MPPKKPTSSTTIETTLHKSDKRVNIPTAELQDFIKEEESNPKPLLYPRDPSLDPQLVWKGKDEQDAGELEIPAVPIYIQEKIHPLAIIESIREEAKKQENASQLNLFADFNGIKFEELIEFYQHSQNWSNRMILGDSLMVMTSLAEKEGLKGQVQMIYMDPPYGIRFGSNWQVSTRKRDVKDGKAEDATRQPEQIKAFRDTWELGIHSYLSYLRDRLVIARELLTETGSCFVQIGDENVHLVRSIMDEVFGSENFVSLITFRKTTGVQSSYVASVSDYLIWYAKVKEQGKFRNLYRPKAGDDNYRYVMLENGNYRSLTNDELVNSAFTANEGQKIFRFDHLLSSGPSKTEQEFIFCDKIFRPPVNNHWKTNIEGMYILSKSNRIMQMGKTLSYLRFLDDFNVFPFTNFWDDTTVGGSSDRWYVVQTTPKVIERCLLMTTDPGDLVIDPTCGSGTTAYVAEQWGRRWITIDTSRVALALARTRLMSAKYPYYLLADSSEGQKKEAELTGQSAVATKTEGEIKKGFVYRLVPHITLKSIANNQEIDAIHAKHQPFLEELRHQLNTLLHKGWEEWEVPRDLEATWPKEAKEPHALYWEGKIKRQQEIDASISRHADTELLYDQPYEDKKRIRVTGPLTVESLSPHRVLSTDEPKPKSEQNGSIDVSRGDNFVIKIIENLKKAGVQNSIKNERLKFDSLEPWSGEYIQAAGDYTENDQAKRVAVCIGPEYGTVNNLLVNEAAKEAVKFFDLLVVCGFAFEANVGEDAKNLGRLTVLKAKMNPDLMMSDELLKKTGTGNLFMVFGEPDIKIHRTEDHKIRVEIKGLDVYDPTTGQVRSSSTDDIACWFIDTRYNEESFFVRHAYFCGANEPYQKLQKALKAEISEDAWSSLYATVSRPFEVPETGKIAVKVINHYGDEVLKVYEVK